MVSDGEGDGGLGEPIEASALERGLAVFVLVAMGSAMAYAVFVVVKYWGDVSV